MDHLEHLKVLRKAVDECDRALVQAFCRRMDLSEQIGRVKAASGVPVFDEKRDCQVIANAVALGFGHPTETLALIREVIKLSKTKQQP
jgi:chorismate mutase